MHACCKDFARFLHLRGPEIDVNLGTMPHLLSYNFRIERQNSKQYHAKKQHEEIVSNQKVPFDMFLIVLNDDKDFHGAFYSGTNFYSTEP